MISGFNSDIEFQGTIYHVQTEDKGLDTPIILSLVYSRGEILASKRSPYDDLITAGFDESELNERLQRQHKLIIAAIRGGRIDDLKRMTMNASSRRRSAPAEQGGTDITLVAGDVPASQSEEMRVPALEASPEPVLEPVLGPARETIPEPAFESAPADMLIEIPEQNPLAAAVNVANAPSVSNVPVGTVDTSSPIPRPQGDLVNDLSVDIIEVPFFEDVEILEYGVPDEDTILPAEAVKIITEHVGVEEVDESKLKIRLLGRTTFMSGQEATLDILVAYGGKLGKGVAGAHIMVKIIGSSFKPQIFHTKADDNGISQVHIQVPEVRSGRAVILIKALYQGEEIELRQVITQR